VPAGRLDGFGSSSFALAGRSLVGGRAVGAAGPGRQGGGRAGRRLGWCGSVGGVAAGGRVSVGAPFGWRVVFSGQSCTVASMVSRRARPTFSELRYGPMQSQTGHDHGRRPKCLNAKLRHSET
jgi:hypothetical protein